MRCTQRKCNNEVHPSYQQPNKKYCTLYCESREAQLVKNDKAIQKLKDKYLTKKKVHIVNGSDCKYCKDSNHTGFCSDEHQRIYEEIMAPIDKALGR